MTFVQVFMLHWFKKLPWKEIGLLIALLVFEVAMHPLGIGPDRRIHDPAVYRLADPTYLPGDWYTDMAVDSGVYMFYAALVNFGPSLGIPEELWRQGIYIVCLILLYGVMIHIARLFSESVWVVPLIASFHAVLVLWVPPIWLYGPFIQIDGGLAPRSVGVALSFLALYFLLKQARFLPWILLGIATLIHVSNSFIVFALFFGAWLMQRWVEKKGLPQSYWKELLNESAMLVTLYLLAGGWFVLWVALGGNAFSSLFSTEKFIWAWVYFRAPYMALPEVRFEAWFIFFFHVVSLGVGWYLLRPYFDGVKKKMIDLLGYIGVGALGFFFAFYMFAFVIPWLPGFQFYSLRVIYFMHFITYLFVTLLLVRWIDVGAKTYKIAYTRIGTAIFMVVSLSLLTPPGKFLLERSYRNLIYTWVRLQDFSNPIGPPSTEEEVGRYIFLYPEPFLAPPDWYGSPAYLPHVASFKTFGFTPRGLEEWYERVNDVSRGKLESMYQNQKEKGVFEPVYLKWGEVYSKLTERDVRRLAKKYHFRFFVTYREKEYAFPVVTEDARYRLYRIEP